MATRRELVEAVGERYRSVGRANKGKILDEFVAVTGLHRNQLRDIAAGLDPVRLLRDIRTAQQKLVELADAVASAPPTENSPLRLDAFLSGLKTLWKDGAARPTATDKPSPDRWWRSRSDPLVEVT